ncbi:hypothetical protein ACFWY9_07730 [Amycolatopsis sp. NPDC059027]|uniref:hypothetical protein n=1 Tax=unclassified Amycolatopsis TaxID=2618356 RepID=UPI0036735717
MASTRTPLTGTPRWYLVGALPDEHPVAHLMTRSEDLRYRRSACGDRESRSWTPVDLTESDVAPCPACVSTLPAPPACTRGQAGQLSFDLPLG